MKTKIRTYGFHDQFSLKPENQESLSVVVNNGTSLVIDCPSHTLKSLHNDTTLITKSLQTKVDYLLITHIDNDHVGGIEQLLWWKIFAEKEKLNLITHPAIISDIWKRLEPMFGQDRTVNRKQKMKREDYISFIPLEYDQEVQIPGFGKVISYEKGLSHCVGMDVLACKVFDEKGKNIANFSGDTGFDNSLIDFLGEKKGPIIHEVGAYSEGSFSHTHINELIQKTQRSIQERIFINHIPEILEDSIQEKIIESGSPLRFANFLNY